MHTPQRIDPSTMDTAELLSAVRDLDKNLTELELAVFRAASAGLRLRSLELSQQVKACRENRRLLLNALDHRNRTGAFAGLGDANIAEKKAKKEAHDQAEAKKGEASKRIDKVQDELKRIAVSLAKKLAPEGSLDRTPARIKALYFHLATACRDFIDASGAMAAKDRSDVTRRAESVEANVRMLLLKDEQFFRSLPTFSEKPQSDAFAYSRVAFKKALLGLQREPGIACNQCSVVLRNMAKRPKRQVSPTKLKAVKKQISLSPGARVPEPRVLRILARQIALRCPRPKTMKEEVYGDFILEMTKRAAVYAANEQLKGSDTTASVAAATNAVVTQDLAAVQEEVTTGVSAPAGEQVVAAAITSAATQILQGAGDAGTLPSVPVTPVSAQPQLVVAPTAADSIAPTMTDAEMLAVFSGSSQNSPVPTSAPASTSTPTNKTEVVVDEVEESPDEGDLDVVQEPKPFYRRPAFWGLCALGLVGGYMAKREGRSGMNSRAPSAE